MVDETAADLGEMESEEEFTFPPKERRVFTQPLDLSVHTLVDQWTDDHLTLPSIQREYVWDNGKASRLIESLLLNIPIPVLYFAETQDARYEVIDGHQRVRSIVRYVNNEFSLSGLGVLGEYASRRFHQLPEREQRFLRMRTLRVILISIESHPNMKFEIFERLNTGAIQLNPQELRNSIYRGAFNEMLHRLAEDRQFRRLIGTKNPRKRMVDEEVILRFFALREQLAAYRTPLKRFLNEYMGTMRDVEDAAITTYERVFREVVALIQDYLDGSAFRVTDRQGQILEANVNRALIDAQMLAFSWIDAVDITDRDRIRHDIFGLFENEGFLDSIRRATGDRARTLKRIRETARALERGGASINLPFDLQR